MATKVLIVDDNVYLNHLLQIMLADEGYEVDAARYAGEGYSAFLRKRPDVILTDIHMPGGTGLEMMKKIRRPGQAVRLIGVGVSGLGPPIRQLGLWDAGPEKSRKLQEAIDELREKYGDQVIHHGESS